MKNTALTLALLFLMSAASWALSLDQIDDLIRGYKLDQAQTEIRSLLDKDPENPELLKRMGFVLVLKIDQVPAEQNAEYVQKARAILQRAVELGCKDPLVGQILSQLPEEGGLEPVVFSKNPEADAAMKEAEHFFTQGKFEEAIASYTRAAARDPKLYQAPLYEGDAWVRSGDIGKACQAYDRAIAIDPDTETAYRYKGNALTRQGDIESGLQCYAQAVVAEPGSEMAWKQGLERWATATDAKIELPQLKIPVELNEDGTKITLLVKEDDKTAAPWLAYGAARTIWRTKHPTTPYRRTLAEEVEALTATAQVAEELQSQGKLALDDRLKLLVDVHHDQLMEPLVLFCLADRDIIDDYIPFRENYRNKLVQFLVDYAVQRKMR